ncbi:MAG: hypothetical protein M0D53_07005 [Flavobacterium sp. JAD_PAG50586_2]|nr:MAG: hypothetical protein M0D53_07005 [Flavobacterium sp. JAD_PAG50586_2]
MSSPGTDLLPNLFVGFLLLTLLFYKDSLSEKGLIYIVLPMFCITLKLSTFPIILITLFAIYVKQQRFLTSFNKLFLFGTLFIVPWIIRNIILSGYLIYPNVFLDFFNFDWKVPKEKVIVTQSWIYSFGRIPFKYYEEVLNIPFKEWIVVWWDAALLKNKYLYILALLSPLFYSFSILINRKEKNNQITLVLFVAYLSCFIWLITAPDIRFSASFVIILALFPLYLIKNTVDRYKRSTNVILLMGFSFVFFVFTKNGFNFFDEDYNIRKISTYVYLPLDVSELKDKKLIPFKEFDLVTKRHESIKIFSSIGDSQTFDKFPCTVNFSFGCGLRGNSLSDGFYSK